MHGIDHKGVLNDILVDETRKIPKAHQKLVCKLNCNKNTCRYVALGYAGFVCVKNTSMKEQIDKIVEEGKMVACGDNCEGLGDISPDKNNKYNK